MQVVQGQALDQYKDTDTADRWYIIFETEEEGEELTYGPFLTEQEAKEDMPRVVSIYTSTRGIG